MTLWTAARQASLSITNSRSLLKLMSIESVMPSSHLILCCPLLLLPSLFPSIRVFAKVSPSNEYSGLISCRVDGLDLLAVQGTLKSLLQHHSSKASFLHAQPSEQNSAWITDFPGCYNMANLEMVMLRNLHCLFYNI